MVNMNALLKQAQKMQDEMQKIQSNLSAIIVEGSAGGGMVRVKANCKLEILSVAIEPEVIKADDKEMLEELVVAAVNQAMQTAQQRANDEMQKVTGGMLSGLKLPENFKLPGM